MKTLNLMPKPFDWIEISNKGYSISKYPITNAQYEKFIEAGGYNEPKWWSETGWEQKLGHNWTQHLYRHNDKLNGADYPVVGVTWYEVVAFCLWLSDVTNEQIMLPLEEQWRYAAHGEDCRTYPWGEEWDCTRCNNSVEPCKNDRTTPVTQYEGKGDSPFGVVDMVGNVWEWCLTNYASARNDLESTDIRCIQGGAWIDSDIKYLRCRKDNWYTPFYKSPVIGFRIVRL